MKKSRKKTWVAPPQTTSQTVTLAVSMLSPISSWIVLKFHKLRQPNPKIRKKILSRIFHFKFWMMSLPVYLSQPRAPTRISFLGTTNSNHLLGENPRNSMCRHLLSHRTRRPLMNWLRNMRGRSIKPRVYLKKKRKESPKKTLFIKMMIPQLVLLTST